MGKRKLLYLLLVAFLLPFTASAQQAIPYTYGFEDNDLSADGWTTVACHAQSGIATGAKQNGTYGFRFRYTTTPPQYLISPELTGTDRGVDVSFSYKQGGSSYHESFQVGYSTTNATDMDAFTWESELTTTDTQWHVYETSFPAGTKYVAVKCTSNDQLYLYLDDFSFTAPASCPKPTGLAANNVEARSAVISWTSDADGFNLRYKAADDKDYTIVEGATNPYTLEGLTPETAYQVSVQAVCSAEEQSNWSADVSFTTPESCMKPSLLNSGTGVLSDTEILLNFQPNDPEQDQWQVAYAKYSDINTGDYDDHSMYTIIDVTSYPYTITGLEPETQYVVDIRAFCGGEEYSAWPGPFGVFTTEKTYPEPTNVAAENIAAKSADITWTAGRNEKKWNLRYRPVTETIIEGGISTNFDDGTIGDWTNVINGEGDGFFAIDLTTAFSGQFTGHSGTYAGCVRSWAGSALNADNWLISPQVELGGKLTFWVLDDGQYHENYSICVSTNGTNPDDFTVVATPNPATDSWTMITVDLSAYAGETGYIAFHHVDSDQDFLLIDDIQYVPAGATIIEEPWTEVNGIAAKTYTITGLTPETEYEAQVQGDFEESLSEWSASAEFTTLDLKPTDLAVTPAATTAELTWNGSSCSYDVRIGTLDPDAPMTETETSYDDGTSAGSIGTGGGQFWWGSVFNNVASLTKVSVFDSQYPMTGTVTIYNDGTTAPAGEPVAEMELTFTGAGDFVEVSPREAIELDPTKPTWVVIYNESGATYPAAYSTVSNANACWVSLDNAEWDNVNNLGVSVGSWMIRVTGQAPDPDAIIWTETASTSETSYTFEGLDPETSYIAEVSVNCPDDDETSDWVRTSFTTLNAETPISDLVAENITKSSADIDWTVNGAEEEWNLRYRRTAGTTQGFESGMGDWFAIDADGDGYNWVTDVPYEAHSGSGLIASASYVNNVGAVNPDNWLVSPEVTLGGELTLWAKGQDASWAAEVFGVYVSNSPVTESTFDASAFTQVGADVTTTGEWTLYTFDLSAFSGTGNIAIRHYNVTDMFNLDVDDIKYISPDDVVEDWTVVEGITEHPYTIEELEEETEYEVQVQSVLGKQTSDWSESVIFTTAAELIVLDNDSEQEEGQKNTDLLAEKMGKSVNFTISGRTLYKDGSWNTIALPFQLTADEIENSPLAGATIKTIDPNSTVVGTHVTLDMMDFAEHSTEVFGYEQPVLEYGWPYFVKWPNGGEDIVDPTFNNVTIAEAEDGMLYTNFESTIIGVYTYSSLPLTPASELADDELQVYYMGADNKLKFTAKPRLLNAFRSGFCFIGDDSAGALDITINWGDETTTGIVEIEGADSKATSAPTGIYNLQGVKLNDMPKQKGVYINNGKKVIIK